MDFEAKGSFHQQLQNEQRKNHLPWYRSLEECDQQLTADL
jgi:hypothetical protein